ncbi:MAG: metalloregulator ArsR/SmtB family transcription factor [Anaeromyxobacteraceae bacterium]
MTNAHPHARMLDALGDPTRRAVFERLAGGPLPVGALAAGLPVSRPAVSQHLRVLKDAGLVIDRAEGTRRLYQANPQGLEVLRAYLDRFWDRALQAFAAEAERVARVERKGRS